MNFRTIIKASLLLILIGCKAEHHDYVYSILNQTTQDSAIIVTYQTNDMTSSLCKEILPGEELQLTERIGVTGDDIWDIETSTKLYKITSLRVANFDSTKLSVDLTYKKHWNAPTSEGGKGKYMLTITDDHFLLKKQEQYKYIIKSNLSDTLFTTSYLVGRTRRKDTIVGANKITIGTIDIYTFDESHKEESEYIQQKLSGLSSITLWNNENYRNIDLSKDTANFIIEKDSCTLIVDKSLFEK